jgi:hypothetical protein
VLKMLVLVLVLVLIFLVLVVDYRCNVVLSATESPPYRIRKQKKEIAYCNAVERLHSIDLYNNLFFTI